MRLLLPVLVRLGRFYDIDFTCTFQPLVKGASVQQQHTIDRQLALTPVFCTSTRHGGPSGCCTRLLGPPFTHPP